MRHYLQGVFPQEPPNLFWLQINTWIGVRETIKLARVTFN